ncbi:putative extracellular exo-polygalacturonase [Trichodelitschia bisporula]|uniref:galacturonan 1,4-alpha-galacturonidase n=1 Tax=Trichodelitschia bisporula TaxID=703511 RepID=A0A6G1HIF2_9PEZI|nr:putative extracellular exo-polygalacturonase [Trichodelitschia bisporula]
MRLAIATSIALGATASLAGGVNVVRSEDGNRCTVTAEGPKKDDVPNILKAFAECGNGGTVVFPAEQSYWIATRLNPRVHNIKIEWKGQWTLSDDLAYWRKNSYPVEFQNHAAGVVFSGDGISINGYGTGGIHGNGEAWYNAEEAHTKPGRPMPFVFWNVSSVVVRNFFVKQPPLWAVNIMNGTDMVFDNIYVNATATRAPWGKNWVQNTDGFDTMDAKNIRLHNFVYQGGDDCIAIKPRSCNIEVRNVTCRGGNGIAIGSLGQYLEDSSVENVVIRDVKIIRYNEDMHNSAYIKTWIGGQASQKGYESAGKPRGGGWGIVRNLTFLNFDVEDADGGPAITQDNGNNGSFSGTSKLEISNIRFENFTGYLHGRGTTASVSCSKAKPCRDIVFKNINLRPSKGDTKLGTAKCSNVPSGAVKGLTGSGCG